VTAGYSGTPLPRKLGVKDQHLVLLDRVPAGVDLGDLGSATVLRRLPPSPSLDLTVTFQTRAATLAQRLPRLFERTATAGMVWVCWPKKSARAEVEQALGVTCDLDDHTVRSLGLALGFVDVKVAAIDDRWSGLKFVRRLADR
jgi:hypothetical protein